MTEIIETQGVIIRCLPYGETSSIIDVFTEQVGLLKGYVKGARTKRNSGIYQKGNLVTLVHSRRLSEQLGTIQADSVHCLWHELSKNRLYFKIFDLLCNLKSIILPPNVYEPVIYNAFIHLIELLLQSPDEITVKRNYIDYLYITLEQIGYAPDFKRCGVSGITTDLIYVSPKSVRAICKSVGLEYHDRMLKLPEFLINHTAKADINDIENGQKIIQLCYNKFIFYPRELELSLTV